MTSGMDGGSVHLFLLPQAPTTLDKPLKKCVCVSFHTSVCYVYLFCLHVRGRPRTAWMDNVKTWTGLPVEESIRMTEDGDKWRKYVHGVATSRIEDG